MSKTYDKLDSLFSEIIDILDDFHHRTYEVKKISDLLDEALNYWQEHSNYEDSNHREITNNINDLSDNIESYLKHFDGDHQSLQFITDELNRILGSISNLESDNESDEDLSDDTSNDLEDEFFDLNITSSSPLNSDNETDDAATSKKQSLSNGFTGYESDSEAIKKEFHHALKADQLFFDINRNKKPNTKTLSTQFLEGRRTIDKPQIINSDDTSARKLITADITAVKDSLPANPADAPKTDIEIEQTLKWHRKKARDWNRQKIQRGNTEINYQYQPAPTNLGNYFMSGLGQYGTGAETSTLNILEVINDYTDENPEFEKKLGELLLESSCKGKAITEDDLYNKGFLLYENKKLRQRYLNYLNRLALNTFFKEVSRRKYQGYKSTADGNTLLSEFPFGVAIAKTLILIKDGHLRMADVFDKDAEYGVFAGNNIMHERNLPKTQAKFEKVLFLYNSLYAKTLEKIGDSHYLSCDPGKSFLKDHPEGKIVASPEANHQALLKAFGGESESSGDEYSASNSDEEAESVSARCRL